MPHRGIYFRGWFLWQMHTRVRDEQSYVYVNSKGELHLSYVKLH